MSDIEDKIFKGANFTDIERTWKRLAQESSVDGLVPFHCANAANSGMLCVKQVIAFCGFALNVVLPFMFPGDVKWWQVVDNNTDIALEITYAFDGCTSEAEKSTSTYASQRLTYTHRGVVTVTYNVFDKDKQLGTYVWKDTVKLTNQSTDVCRPQPATTKRFGGLGALFHIVNSELHCPDNFCALLESVTQEAPLHNDCVIKLHNAFEICLQIHLFHLKM